MFLVIFVIIIIQIILIATILFDVQKKEDQVARIMGGGLAFRR